MLFVVVGGVGGGGGWGWGVRGGGFVGVTAAIRGGTFSFSLPCFRFAFEMLLNAFKCFSPPTVEHWLGYGQPSQPVKRYTRVGC